jgi:hypothetical protein
MAPTPFFFGSSPHGPRLIDLYELEVLFATAIKNSLVRFSYVSKSHSNTLLLKKKKKRHTENANISKLAFSVKVSTDGTFGTSVVFAGTIYTSCVHPY